MSNPMKYIKDLEAAGFQRNQAEAQVQMVLDAVEGDLATKSDFENFQERSANRFTQSEQRTEARFAQFEQRIEARFAQFEQKIEDRLTQSEQKTNARFIQADEKMNRRFIESELRLLTRLGFLIVSTTSIAVAVLTWLIKA